MARIRQNTVVGDLGRYEYEVHYNAKHACFEAKKYPDQLTAFTDRNDKILDNSETELEKQVRQIVKRYESTQTNWELYIVYKFNTTNHEVTQLASHHSSYYQKGIELDYDLVYYNKVDTKEYYVTKKEWDQAKEHNWKISPKNADHGNYAVGRYAKRIKHTPELEQFFASMIQSMGILIEKVKAVLDDENKIVELATAQTKLIG